jgi:hypothetical protein
MKDVLVDAAMTHFEAQERVAEANLRVYLTHAVGVAEHPNFVGEIVRLTKEIAEARECTAVLSELTDND